MTSRRDQRREFRRRRAVDGVRRWRRARGPRPMAADAEVVAPLPRRAPLLRADAALGEAGTPPMRVAPQLQASLLTTLRRLLLWIRLTLSFLLAIFFDKLRRRDSVERRAVRLRETFERIGGTFLKLGQQMSIRIDLLPLPYCNELAKLLDRVPPFPTEQAIAVIERTTGRPLRETFRWLDPDPIGSASLACVYQAVLLDGEKVAVKVRRPRIMQTFAADWRALSWILGTAELLTIVRPGQLRDLLRDLAAMFMEELDFRREARHTDIFRRRARESRLRFISAPRVFFEPSSDEVLVTEFVGGVWMWEVLWAVEHRDVEGLGQLDRLDIDPILVAQRLFEASLFGIFENLIFHADPHPANVVVRPGGEIVLIDFGSCGTYTESQLHVMRHFHYCQASEDVGGMVQCVLTLMEPLPPVDVDALRREVEEVFSESLQALRSRGSEWWERTTAGVWIGFLRMARKYRVRAHLDILRMVRSTLLYDTLAARLDPQFDVYAEYQRYRSKMAKAARERFRKRVRNLIEHGIDDRAFLRLEELADLGQRLTYRLERFVDTPTYNFSLLAGKAVFAASTLLQWALLTLFLFALAATGRMAWIAVRGEPGGVEPALGQVSADVVSHPIFAAAALLLLLVNLRRIVFRFQDKDVG